MILIKKSRLSRVSYEDWEGDLKRLDGKYMRISQQLPRTGLKEFSSGLSAALISLSSLMMRSIFFLLLTTSSKYPSALYSKPSKSFTVWPWRNFQNRASPFLFILQTYKGSHRVVYRDGFPTQLSWSTWKYQFSHDHWSQAMLNSASTWMGGCSSVARVLLLTLKNS